MASRKTSMQSMGRRNSLVRRTSTNSITSAGSTKIGTEVNDDEYLALRVRNLERSAEYSKERMAITSKYSTQLKRWQKTSKELETTRCRALVEQRLEGTTEHNIEELDSRIQEALQNIGDLEIQQSTDNDDLTNRIREHAESDLVKRKMDSMAHTSSFRKSFGRENSNRLTKTESGNWQLTRSQSGKQKPGLPPTPKDKIQRTPPSASIALDDDVASIKSTEIGSPRSVLDSQVLPYDHSGRPPVNPPIAARVRSSLSINPNLGTSEIPQVLSPTAYEPQSRKGSWTSDINSPTQQLFPKRRSSLLRRQEGVPNQRRTSIICPSGPPSVRNRSSFIKQLPSSVESPIQSNLSTQNSNKALRQSDQRSDSISVTPVALLQLTTASDDEESPDSYPDEDLSTTLPLEETQDSELEVNKQQSFEDRKEGSVSSNGSLSLSAKRVSSFDQKTSLITEPTLDKRNLSDGELNRNTETTQENNKPEQSTLQQIEDVDVETQPSSQQDTQRSDRHSSQDATDSKSPADTSLAKIDTHETEDRKPSLGRDDMETKPVTQQFYDTDLPTSQDSDGLTEQKDFSQETHLTYPTREDSPAEQPQEAHPTDATSQPAQQTIPTEAVQGAGQTQSTQDGSPTEQPTQGNPTEQSTLVSDKPAEQKSPSQDDFISSVNVPHLEPPGYSSVKPLSSFDSVVRPKSPRGASSPRSIKQVPSLSSISGLDSPRTRPSRTSSSSSLVSVSRMQSTELSLNISTKETTRRGDEDKDESFERRNRMEELRVMEIKLDERKRNARSQEKLLDSRIVSLEKREHLVNDNDKQALEVRCKMEVLKVRREILQTKEKSRGVVSVLQETVNKMSDTTEKSKRELQKRLLTANRRFEHNRERQTAAENDAAAEEETTRLDDEKLNEIKEQLLAEKKQLEQLSARIRHDRCEGRHAAVQRESSLFQTSLQLQEEIAVLQSEELDVADREHDVQEMLAFQQKQVEYVHDTTDQLNRADCHYNHQDETLTRNEQSVGIELEAIRDEETKYKQKIEIIKDTIRACGVEEEGGTAKWKQIEKWKSENELMTTESDVLQESIAELDGDINNISNRIEDLRKQLSSKKDKISSNYSQLLEIKTRLQDQETKALVTKKKAQEDELRIQQCELLLRYCEATRSYVSVSETPGSSLTEIQENYVVALRQRARTCTKQKKNRMMNYINSSSDNISEDVQLPTGRLNPTDLTPINVPEKVSCDGEVLRGKESEVKIPIPHVQMADRLVLEAEFANSKRSTLKRLQQSQPTPSSEKDLILQKELSLISVLNSCPLSATAGSNRELVGRMQKWYLLVRPQAVKLKSIIETHRSSHLQRAIEIISKRSPDLLNRSLNESPDEILASVKTLEDKYSQHSILFRR